MAEHIGKHVHHQLHPLAARADPSAGLSVHRRVCAREPDPVLDVDAARLARHACDGLVRLFLPRSAARHAAARGPGDRAGRRPRQPGGERSPAAGARHGRAAAAAHLDLHERVRLPREPEPGDRPHRADGLPRGKIPQRRSRQGKRRQRAQCLPHQHRPRSHRGGADRGPDRAPHRAVCLRGPDGLGRRPHRHDPVRLARRCLSAGGRQAAGRRRPDRSCRRDRARRSRR